jgi:hypothetical protein
VELVTIGEIVKAVRDIVCDLSDIVGIIEKNVASYDRISSRFRRKRVVSRLTEILLLLTSWRMQNYATLFLMASEIRKISKRYYDETGSPIAVKRPECIPQFEGDLHRFLYGLLSASDLISEYKADIVRFDFSVYEKIEDCVRNRIKIIGLLVDRETAEIAVDDMEQLYDAYEDLVRSLQSTKEEIQSIINTLEKE